MDIDVDGDDDDDGDDDEDDASSSKDPFRRQSDALCKFPSGSLPEVRSRKFLVSLYVESPIRLHGVEIFDEVKPPTPDMGIDTGGSYPYGCSLKSLGFAFSMAFLPGA
jgi:hypothetical protein